ncbi:MAG: hypothetical protein ACW98Y_18495 [Candidatus Thorarchaeota archaeon]|jgi:hypothetical protein
MSEEPDSIEPETIDKKSKKAKADFAEVEFEIGNIEFEAKGKSAVVERMFRLLLEKIEEGKLVATLQMPEEEDDDVEEEEESSEEESEEASDPVEEESKQDITPEVGPPPENDDSDPIPSEAYLDPPPAWDSLEEESPPESPAEKESRDDSF